MSRHREALIEAFREIPETCPEIELAFSQTERLVKEKTQALRDAYIAALERSYNLEDELTTANDRIEELEKTILNLENELVQLRYYP